jgi:predicted nucleotidyltransferase component of viral defense system
MLLHNDKENFDIAIRAAARHFNTSAAIIEKDYYVTLVLCELSKQVPDLLFKGGTSLSKCHKIIDRFSEDIDITLDAERQSQLNRRKLKYTIIEICKSLGLNLLNESETRSRRDYNCYKIDYSAMHNLSGLNPQLLIETVFIVKAFPDEIKKASSMIYDYLEAIGNKEAITQYKLEPFDIRVQTLDRTLIDKVFAICDYMLDNNTERQSRHIYDLSRLLPLVKTDDNLKSLIKEVREDRKTGTKCYSAQDGVSVPKLLRKIIDTEFFKKDYEDITEKLLSKPVAYNEAIKAIEAIISSGVFEN